MHREGKFREGSHRDVPVTTVFPPPRAHLPRAALVGLRQREHQMFFGPRFWKQSHNEKGSKYHRFAVGVSSLHVIYLYRHEVRHEASR